MKTNTCMALVAALLCISSVSAAPVVRSQEPRLIAELKHGASTVRFEQIDGDVLLVSEIADGTASDAAPVLPRMMKAGHDKSVRLCPAHLFGLLSSQPIPAELWHACPDPSAKEQLQGLRTAASKWFEIYGEDISTVSSYCVGSTGHQSFRSAECSRLLDELYDSPFYDDDHAYWCANTLLKNSNRVFNEGEEVGIATVSCTGTTRFRFYKRADNDDPWTKYRDYYLGSSKLLTLYAFDLDTYSDSNFRFLMESGDGAWHRSTGYFIDD
jgi:hypothetical protein